MRADEYKNIYLHQQSLWWYQGMASIIRRLLRDYLPKNRKRTILDAGCGTGAAFPILQPLGSVTGVDIAPEALRFAKKAGEKTKKANVAKLPFPKHTFDAVVSLDVLYHTWVEDYHKALGEYVRVLKPGGIFLWREPAYDWLKSGHDRVNYTERRFTKQKMQEGLRNLPLDTIKISYINSILFPLVIVKRLPTLLGIQKPQAKSDIGSVALWLNTVLTSILSLEAKLIAHISFPFGSSVICVAKKK